MNEIDCTKSVRKKNKKKSEKQTIGPRNNRIIKSIGSSPEDPNGISAKYRMFLKIITDMWLSHLKMYKGNEHSTCPWDHANITWKFIITWVKVNQILAY